MALEPLPADPAAQAELWTAVPAVAESLRAARRMVSGWLHTLRWPEDECIDILLAVNEALSNVVDHAYPPFVTDGWAHLYGWQAVDDLSARRRVVLVVTDGGRWRPAAVDPGFRGRGLPTMSASMDSVHIEPTPRGTTVIMTSRPVSAAVCPTVALSPAATARCAS